MIGYDQEELHNEEHTCERSEPRPPENIPK